MKLKIYIKVLMLILFFSVVHADEDKCNKFEKLSAKYIECNAKKLKDKTSDKIKKSKENFEKSDIKEKLINFKNKKTLIE